MKGLLIVNAFLKNGKFGALYDLLADAARRMEIGLAVQTNAEVVSALCRGAFQSEDYDFCLFWDKDVQLAAQLEGLGMRLFNSSDAIAACDDKALTYLRLKPCGIPMPETVIAPKTFSNVGYTDLTFVREIGAQMRYPLIVKECFGSFGMQVYWCRDEAELLERIGKLGGAADGSDFARTLSVVRSRAIYVTLAVQSLGQLQNRYPNNLWAEIVGNCDVQLMLGCTDDVTAEYFSARSGDMSIQVNSTMTVRQTMAVAQVIPQYRQTQGQGKRRLLTPDEVLRLPNQELLVVIRGHNLLKLEKVDYTELPLSKEIVRSSVLEYTPERPPDAPQA